MSTHVIVGAGQAGACAAVAMRKAGFSGRIMLIGEEPGLPYEKPPLSKAVIAGADDALPPVIYSERLYAEHAIETRFGVAVSQADAASRRLVLDNGEAVDFDRLLIATGGRARHPAIPGHEQILTLRTVADAARIREQLVPDARILCIGAGIIGMELAAGANSKGCIVTVVEAGSSVMERALCPEIRRFLENRHRRAGNAFRFDTMPLAVNTQPDGSKRVLLSDGSEIIADCVIAGIGIERNGELAVMLGAAVDNGILVDEYGQSSLAGVYAAGDVAAFWHPGLGQRLRLESWRHAQNHGIAVGQAMCDAGTAYLDMPWFWTHQFDLNVQVWGLPQQAHRSLYRRGEKSNGFVGYHLDRDGVVIGATAVNDPRNGRAAQALIKSQSPIPETLQADLRPGLQEVASSFQETVASSMERI